MPPSPATPAARTTPWTTARSSISWTRTAITAPSPGPIRRPRRWPTASAICCTHNGRNLIMLRRCLSILLLGALLGGAEAAVARDYTAGPLQIVEPWARATVTATGGAYLTITNAGGEAD